MSTTSIFFNQSFDKKRLKTFLYWVLKTFGEKEALTVVEQLKSIGFSNATKAGLSIGLHDLKTPYKKRFLISHAQKTMRKSDQEFQGAEVTATERSQRIVDTWHRTSEDLKKQVVDYFSTYDQLNSVYMMALSGARGNFSQVRQLIGMRGLMADPQGQIISFPIRSNLREGLTLTEYFISCSGARKGLVDTALRTADTGYLTRRLVDISHHIVVKKVTCYTSRGIALKTLRTSQKVLLPLRDRLVGRVLAENIYSNDDVQLALQTKDVERDVLYPNGSTARPNQSEALVKRVEKKQDQTRFHQNVLSKQTKKVIAKKNQEISPDLAFKISLAKESSLYPSITWRAPYQIENKLFSSKNKMATLGSPQVLVRSPLTCTYTHELCQLCYGWSMAQGTLVSLGEAVGVIAGQSIGEPGTQLTMRTFHTGGVFSGDLLQEIRAPHSGKILFPKALQGLLIRTSQGKIAFLIKVSGELVIDTNHSDTENVQEQNGVTHQNKTSTLPLAPSTILFVRQGETVKDHQILAELAITSEEGNQPIKSRQTLFSEIRGRIVQWKSMSSRMHRTKGVTEPSLYQSKLLSKPLPDQKWSSWSTQTFGSKSNYFVTNVDQLESASDKEKQIKEISFTKDNEKDKGKDEQVPYLTEHNQIMSLNKISLPELKKKQTLVNQIPYQNKAVGTKLSDFVNGYHNNILVRKNLAFASRVLFVYPETHFQDFIDDRKFVAPEFGMPCIGARLLRARASLGQELRSYLSFALTYVRTYVRNAQQTSDQKVLVSKALRLTKTKFWYVQQTSNLYLVSVFSLFCSKPVITTLRDAPCVQTKSQAFCKHRTKKKGKLFIKTGFQAHLGTMKKRYSATPAQNSRDSILNKSNYNNQSWLVERRAQHHEETLDNFNNITFKKIVLAKRHGLGSIEPAKALKLGLLSVIATRVGASEKTCTRSISIRDDQTLVLRPISRKKISNKDVHTSTLPLLTGLGPLSICNSYSNQELNTLLRSNKIGKNLITARNDRNVFSFDRNTSLLQRLNTIAEEGDLVDESYNKV